MTQALEEKEVQGPRSAGRTRMCAVTRAVLPESALIRFVAAPDGAVVADLKAKLPGRGIWIGARRALVADAVKRNVFSRGLKRQLSPAAELPDLVGTRLREAALGRLGLARKAGAVAAGFGKVEGAIGGERLAAVLIAAEAAADGERKIFAALYRRFAGALPVPVFRIFTARELGLAIGRADVIHAAVLQSPTGASFVEAATRLQRYDDAGEVPAEKRAAEPLGSDE